MSLDGQSRHKPDAVLLALKAACAAHPSQRVTQVIVNALGTTDPFYMDDDEAAHLLAAYAAFEPNRPRVG